MEQIKLKVIGSPPYEDCNVQFTNWNFSKLQYKNIQIVSDDSYTHAVLFGIPTPNLQIPKENVIGFSCEPKELYPLYDYVDYAKKYIGQYFCSDNTGLPNDIFKEYIPFLAPYPLDKIQRNVNKKYIMNMVASNKMNLLGHRLRHEIIRNILNSKMDIHIFGRGLEYIYNDHRIKGTIEDKTHALYPYKYTISIENVKSKYFVSEKFYDPILCGCVPLYWGPSKIEDIFGNESHIILPDDIKGIMNIIEEVYYNHNKYTKNPNVVANKIYNFEVNMCEFVYKQFNKGQ